MIDVTKTVDTTQGVITELTEAASDVAEVILAANQVYGQRFMIDDPEIYNRKYTQDAAIYPSGSPMISSRDSIRKYYFNGGLNKPFRILIKSTGISGTSDLIVEEGVYEMLDDKKGASLDKGKFIALWKKEENEWKLWREIWNTDLQ